MVSQVDLSDLLITEEGVYYAILRGMAECHVISLEGFRDTIFFPR
jgi:hypothetical protein